MEHMKVSVCLATYNGAKYIKEQLDSILIQLSPFDEIIISDDGSKDNTLDAIKEMNDARIRIYANKEKHGVTHNFANALQYAQGDYIFLSDQDDIWYPNKVDICIKRLETSICILHNGSLIDGEGNRLNDDLFAIYGTRIGYWKNLFRNTYVGCCMAFRKELLTHILPIPFQIKMHDMWIALLAEKFGKTELIQDNLIYYRRHANNASTTSNKSSYSKYFQLKYRMEMFLYTILRK